MGETRIEEYTDIHKDKHGGDLIQCPGLLNAVQSITSSGTTARNSADFADDTAFVVVTSDTAIHFSFGDDSVEAASTDAYLPANTPRAFGVDATTPRLAVIDKA